MAATQTFMTRAKPRPRGNYYQDFTVGQVFKHHWGRTINHGDNSLFSSLTLQANPMHFNVEYAKAFEHPDVVLNPMLVFNTIVGLSVEDLSEVGGPFLGIDSLQFHRSAYPQDTLNAISTVVDKRESDSHKAMGIVTWRTEGFNQRGELVIDFLRTNLCFKKGMRPSL
jgi:itaconyl-CoA hydratase